MNRPLAVITALVLGLTSAAFVSPRPAAAAVDRELWHDFNGDGFLDLAIGVPGETVDGYVSAGAVQVLYGTANGFTTAHQQLWTENDVTAADGPYTGDGFGTALASGDFDNDGLGDLAIGIPGQDLNIAGTENRGAVVVLWGSANSGLVDDPAVGLLLGGRTNDRLGYSLATLDMFSATNSDPAVVDGIADLAVAAGNGRVIVEPGGSRQFLTATGRRVLDLPLQDPTRALVLAPASLTSDAPQELVVGFPGAIRDNGGSTVVGAGAFVIVSRGPLDIQASNPYFQEDFGLVSQAGDNFGASFASIPLNPPKPPFEQLIVGIPGQDVVFNGTKRDGAGAALFTLGPNRILLTQASAGVPDNPEAGDRFAESMVVGQFASSDALEDIAFGVPGEKIATKDGAGAVIVQNRRPGGISYQLISQNTTNVPGSVAVNDRFGSALAALDVDDDGPSDLVIAAPRDDEPNGVSNAGTLNVVYSNGNALAPQSTDTLWSQAAVGVFGIQQANDRFGAALR